MAQGRWEQEAGDSRLCKKVMGKPSWGGRGVLSPKSLLWQETVEPQGHGFQQLQPPSTQAANR